MTELTEVQALAKISTVVDESQIKVILASHCTKAQAFLVDKLKKQSERHKETCTYINSANLKLESEIKQAEQEIKSLLIAQETVKLANIELKKELLLAKERKLEIAERVETGVERYEKRWLECKQQYESIPFVQKLLQAKNKTKTLKENIHNLECHFQTINKEIETKKNVFGMLDRKLIIELAEFLVLEMPKGVKKIEETKLKINELTKEVDEIILKEDSQEKNATTIALSQNIAPVSDEKTNSVTLNEKWACFADIIDENLMMSKLQLVNFDLDVISVKLEKIKIKKIEMFTTTPVKVNPVVSDSVEVENSSSWKEEKIDKQMSSYFDLPSIGDDSEKKTQNYSKNKLINILEDIKIDKDDAFNMASEANLEKLQAVNMIGPCITAFDNDDHDNSGALKANLPMETELIEEIDLTLNQVDIVIPPTQFLDITQDNCFGDAQDVHISMAEETVTVFQSNVKSSYESKKRVSFDLSTPMQIDEVIGEDTDKPEEHVDVDANETVYSQLENSATSVENLKDMKMKDMILKKHNLESSPEFVYAKKTVQMANEEKIVTSKFFLTKDQAESEITTETNDDNVKLIEAVATGDDANKTVIAEESFQMDVDEKVISETKTDESHKLEKPVSGILFTHRPQTIPDSLDVSLSTTGYEDGDAGFPHCIDSSLLLSPKADLPMPLSGDNAETEFQDVPNFLSGLRKTGLSFFGMGSSESKTDSNAQNQGTNFSFNFDNKEKKSRGGLFSMFQ